MTIFDIISMFGGLALFLYGMEIMGDGLRNGSSGTLRKVMEKVTDNPVKAFLLGLLVTAIIQSSTATIVITSGLVGAGILSLHQSLGIILGANVGTTITGQIIRLLDVNADSASFLNFFKPSTLAPLAAIVGVILVKFIKNKKFETLGNVLMGFGILFTGLLSMTASVNGLSESESFTRMFTTMGNNPLLGFLAGAAVAFIIQSASASVGILQALAVTGALSMSTTYSIILGIYIGDAVTTALVCYIGSKEDARRTGIIQVIFNCTQIILIFTVVNVLHLAGVFGDFWTSPLNSGGIANINTVFKLSCAIILLPFTNMFEALARKIVKDAPEETVVDERADDYLVFDEALFRSPGVALSSAFNGLEKMSEAAYENVSLAMDVLVKHDESVINQINKDEDYIDKMADIASDYLAKLSSKVSLTRDSDLINYFLKCITSFERIGDLAVNLTESSQAMKEKGLEFSDLAQQEMAVLHDVIDEISEYTIKAFSDGDYEAAKHIEPLEEAVDEMIETLRDRHIERLKKGQCTVDAGFMFLDMLTNVERISDQYSNIGLYTIGLYDNDTDLLQHDYIRSLERGDSTQYTEELVAAREKYLTKIQNIKTSA